MVLAFEFALAYVFCSVQCKLVGNPIKMNKTIPCHYLTEEINLITVYLSNS